jgi:hypothetical protein
MHGGPLWEPLCYVQIGGLLLSTFVTLILVPTLYIIFVRDLKLVKWELPEHAEGHGPPPGHGPAGGASGPAPAPGDGPGGEGAPPPPGHGPEAGEGAPPPPARPAENPAA